jgi:hypothetical protein
LNKVESVKKLTGIPKNEDKQGGMRPIKTNITQSDEKTVN